MTRDAEIVAETESDSGLVARSGFVISLVAWFVAILVSSFWAVTLVSAFGDGSLSDAPLWLGAVANVPLWLVLGGVPIAVARAGNGMRSELRWSFRWTDPLVGLVVGVAGQLLMVPAIYWFTFRIIGERDLSAPARELAERADSGGAIGIAVFVVMTVVFAPITEELFYRGLVLGGLEGLVPRWAAVLVSSFIFGIVHFQLLQLPGLMAVGLVLSLLVLGTDRMGPAIWAHAAFNLTAVVLQLMAV